MVIDMPQLFGHPPRSILLDRTSYLLKKRPAYRVIEEHGPGKGSGTYLGVISMCSYQKRIKALWQRNRKRTHDERTHARVPLLKCTPYEGQALGINQRREPLGNQCPDCPRLIECAHTKESWQSTCTAPIEHGFYTGEPNEHAGIVLSS
jgi:hypothetical protein